jgi:hypothetical protein
MIGRGKAFLALALLVPLSAVFAAEAKTGDLGAAESADAAPGEAPLPPTSVETAIEARNPGIFSANRCPQSPAYRPPSQPSLGISGMGGAVYGQNYGEN